MEAIAAGTAAHPAHARHRHGQDVHRVSDCVEAVSQPLELEPRTVTPAAHSVSCGPQHSREPGLQRVLRLPRRRAGAHRTGRHQEERQSAEERQPVLHHLPDLHERPTEGRPDRRPTSASIRRTSSTSSSSTNAIAAARTTRATGAASSTTSRPPCSSASPPRPSAKTTSTPTPTSAIPVYIYSLKEGINDGFLTPFKVKQISTTLDEYVYTPDDTLIEGEIESGKRYTETDFNKIIEIKEREAHRVKLFMEQINQNEKTLVFCATQDHALAVRDLINQMKTSTRSELLPAGHRERRRARRTAPARLSGQREDHPHHPDHVAKTLHRRGRAQHPQHRADALRSTR